MALDGVLSSGLSAVLTNSAALRVTASNIANINTAGYSRRVAEQQTLAPGGQLAGVALAQIRRVVNNYLDKEVLDSTAGAARYDVQSSMMNQLNAALGQPGDGASIGSQIDALYSALGQSSLDPSSLATRLGALNQFDSVGRTISNLSESVANLRVSADQQVGTAVDLGERRRARGIGARADRADGVTALELAAMVDTIPYEIFTSLAPRVPRLYTRGGAVVGLAANHAADQLDGDGFLFAHVSSPAIS